MTTVEVIFFAIGIWFTAAAIALGLWVAGRRHADRRGGLIDLTPHPDVRKNARGVDLGRVTPDWSVAPGALCPECLQPYGEPHLGTCSRSRMRGGSGIVGFKVAS